MIQTDKQLTQVNRPVFIDLFAGCGGLSLGLSWAGFRGLLSVERSPMAAESYYHNLVKRIPGDDVSFWQRYAEGAPQEDENTRVRRQLEAGLFVGGIQPLLERHEKILRQVISAKIRQFKTDGEVDLIAGGPPCQGFSMAGRRVANDSRNRMPWHFLEFVEMFKPKFVLIENVTGIRLKFVKHGGEAVADQLRIALEQKGPGYTSQVMLLNAHHFGVPQHRPRTVIVGIRNDLATKFKIESTWPFWKSKFAEEIDHLQRVKLAPRPIRQADCTHVKDAFQDLNNRGYLGVKPLGYSAEMRKLRDVPAKTDAPNSLLNHVLRNHCDRVERRFRLYQTLRANRIDEQLVMHAAKANGHVRDQVRRLVDQAIESSGARFPMRSPDGELVLHSREQVVTVLLECRTKKHSQRALSPDSPSPTVMTLPDDFVHHEHARTLTVREMARLQSFPDSFEFRSKETTGGHRRREEVPQYSQVGNAVPPLMAEAIGKQFIELLKETND